jgi:hypothetical protein
MAIPVEKLKKKTASKRQRLRLIISLLIGVWLLVSLKLQSASVNSHQASDFESFVFKEFYNDGGNANVSRIAKKKREQLNAKVSRRDSSNKLNDNQYSTMPMPKNPRIYFIHVGKAGGFTLYDTLHVLDHKWSIKCRAEKSMAGLDDSICYKPSPDESQLSRHIVATFHLVNSNIPMEHQRWLWNTTNTFLITVRDPINRLISAYSFHRRNFMNSTDPKFRAKPQKKKFWFTCFPNGINAMVNTLHYSGNDESILKCKAMGEQVLKGTNLAGGNRKLYWCNVANGNNETRAMISLNNTFFVFAFFANCKDFRYNYQHYAELSMESHPNHAVAAIRTEHLWDDVIALDQALGGTGNFSKAGTIFTHGSDSYNYDGFLDPSNSAYLCCLLYQEMEVYQSVILKAFNLNETEKRQTLANVLTHCQIETKQDLLKDPFSWQALYEKGCYVKHEPIATNHQEKTTFGSAVTNNISLTRPHEDQVSTTMIIANKNKSLYSTTMPDNPRIYFIHVGKAGGATLYETLNVYPKKGAVKCRVENFLAGQDDNTCYQPRPDESQLSRHIISHYHLVNSNIPIEHQRWLWDNTNTFLFTVRDPIDRFVSAFNFHKRSTFRESINQKTMISLPFFVSFSRVQYLTHVGVYYLC